MAHSNRNFVIAYVLLVLLPVLGLVGVLRHGRGLNAPLSVDGVWRWQADSSRLAMLPCAESLLSNQDPTLTISQSGANLVLDFNNRAKAAASGVIEGTTLKASIVRPPGEVSEAGCTGGRALSLTATVDPKADPRSLVGMLSASGCPACAPVEIRASRAPVGTKAAH
jgi:hypothetical protein